MKIQRRVAILLLVAGISLVAVAYVSTQMVAVASPTSVNAQIAVMRGLDNSAVAQDPLKRAEYLTLSKDVVKANPKLTDAIAGADYVFDINSKTNLPSQLSITYDPVYKIDITEEEANGILANINVANAKQRAFDDQVVTYNYSHVEYEGHLYEIALIISAK